MTKPNLNELVVCRSLLDDKIFAKIAALLDGEARLAYDLAARLIDAAEQHGLGGNLFFSYAVYLLTLGSNIAALTSEQHASIGESLKRALNSDACILRRLSKIKPSEISAALSLFDNYAPTEPNSSETYQHLLPLLSSAETDEEFAARLVCHYRAYGYGDIANYRAFHWSDEGELSGIHHYDKMLLSDLVGYESQKAELVQNTAAFLSGKPANNVLLVGARGTGKSSAVKALANEYYKEGLRLLQITKPQLIHLPKIMQRLRLLKSKKFIIFLDDLSFEDFELEYKYLKSAIEGGVESKPANVLIYATSNRRHLVKETWKDRADKFVEEVHRSDSVNETISLSDRFGLTISYLAPNQQEYLKIVDTLLRRHGVELDKETLRVQAGAWEISHSGRSGRVAQQFVDHYLGTH